MKKQKNTLGVVGLGYVGLPLAVEAAAKGYTVIGVDINTELLKTIDARRSPYANDARFAAAIKATPKDQFTTTTDYAALEEADTVVICVPTPTEHNVPDLGLVELAAANVAQHLQKGQLIVLESTVNPGVTRDAVLPILERTSGFAVGKDFFLAHCPERIDPGNPKYYVGNLNRVVGGITPACTKKALAFYTALIDAQIIPLGSTEEAEFVKSWENTQRNVMIAMANSAAIICDGVGMDIERVQKGLQSKVDQFGLSLAQPGIGPGGHCIPEDIHYIIKRARESGIDTRFLDDASELNDRMPKYAVLRLSRLAKEHGEELRNIRVALLGLAYKPDISDTRKSAAIEAGYMLRRYAGSLVAYDPYIDDPTLVPFTISSSLDKALETADAVFVATAHSQFARRLTPAFLKKHGIRYVLDGRNVLNKSAIERAGIAYRGIGR
ncbi:UDP-N-acetyl-D-glucosamine dehydrogenase [Candidatus Saccharibacteria bacterium]|nr:MAG: UDP-N-acetyl-D-glucosamine dehydrogenase [Candidatus Saccharibacteria bacterium]PID99308.1 MAG: UDP-N-acetyl-D-glucosamine dehydrogenase [Candidatus Saccharibacteria bacterium]